MLFFRAAKHPCFEASKPFDHSEIAAEIQLLLLYRAAYVHHHMNHMFALNPKVLAALVGVI